MTKIKMMLLIIIHFYLRRLYIYLKWILSVMFSYSWEANLVIGKHCKERPLTGSDDWFMYVTVVRSSPGDLDFCVYFLSVSPLSQPWGLFTEVRVSGEGVAWTTFHLEAPPLGCGLTCIWLLCQLLLISLHPRAAVYKDDGRQQLTLDYYSKLVALVT